MPKGQKPFIPSSRRPLTPKLGQTMFGKDRATTQADLEPKAAKPAAKPAERANPEFTKEVRKSLRDILRNRAEDIDNAVDALQTGIDDAKEDPV